MIRKLFISIRIGFYFQWKEINQKPLKITVYTLQKKYLIEINGNIVELKNMKIMNSLIA
ncbi:hypothetical protein ACN2C0_09625 [Aliarcobacter butzleri]|uniref:hypothetical protein n=1 Tax=Aliarcobacter butzleri TaxID=28197 RepID=UPI001867063E|nr:hypothetical protein [Aliarcobacter butzleri]MCG3714434.1 hypothetical protein [Aliarcobacter butzleri]MCT7639685.1 hypothetical protein [Aliarcobacter butzleri]